MKPELVLTSEHWVVGDKLVTVRNWYGPVNNFGNAKVIVATKNGRQIHQVDVPRGAVTAQFITALVREAEANEAR